MGLLMKKLFLIFIFLFSFLITHSKINQDIKRIISQNPNIENLKVWIFFTDKGPDSDISNFLPQQLISEKSIKRRLKMDSYNIITYSDLPVYDVYVKTVSENCLKIRKKSRWLNAVSAEISVKSLDIISSLDYVEEICLVHSYKKNIPKVENVYFSKTSQVSNSDSINYGGSFNQLDQINVPILHKMGLSGKGVVIAVLDDGFNLYKTHETFDSLNVISTYDFIHNDTSVDDTSSVFVNGRPQGYHGTTVLSVLGGNTQGVLIGPAYNASFLLARTEIDSLESEMEEDNWIAALEWAESNGADILSSSIGYGHYFSDPPEDSWYTWKEMDGQTAKTSFATIAAEQKGLLVVNSAGNEGNEDLVDGQNSLFAPADGEFVITVGAVDASGNRTYFSSVGPTADGRTKPDVAARGQSVKFASYTNNTGYMSGDGTSYATPLVSGAIALLLEAFPNTTPQKIREAIKNTASQADSTDNLLGWGIIDIKAAYDYLNVPSAISDKRPSSRKNAGHSLNTPNPFSSYTTFRLPNMSNIKLTLYDVLGRVVLRINENEPLIIQSNQLRARGTYFYKIDGTDIVAGKKVHKTGKMLYLSN